MYYAPSFLFLPFHVVERELLFAPQKQKQKGKEANKWFNVDCIVLHIRILDFFI